MIMFSLNDHVALKMFGDDLDLCNDFCIKCIKFIKCIKLLTLNTTCTVSYFFLMAERKCHTPKKVHTSMEQMQNIL